MNEDNRKKVYDVLKSQTGYRDSYEDFNKAFDANEDNRKRVYDVLKSQTGYLDSYEDFSRGMGYPSSNQPGSVSQQVVNEYEQSSMNTDAVLNDNPVGPQRQPAQSPEEDKRTIFANYVQEQLGNIDRELAKPREALPMPAGSAFIPSTAVAAAQRYGNAQTREQQDRYTSLQAARNFLDEANKVVTEAGKKGKTNFVAGALRGIRDKGFDPDTWMMGISETSYYNLLRRAAEKEERGETLSAEEQQLLDAAAVNMAANAYYASDLGRGYKAGAVTAESIPFMLQFAVNPLSGAGTGIAKTILKHGIKRFGLNTAKRTLAGRAVRGAARVAGDAVAAAGVTATTGLGNVAEDAERRMAGDVQFSQDNNGNIQYAGRVNNVEDTGEAIARAFASTFFANQSEMVGNYFSPLMRGISGLVKHIPGVKQLSASKVGRLYRGIKNNPTYKEFTDRTQWHGAIGEYAEEVYNNLASVAMGDMTPEELVDLDNNIDTFLGVGLMSAVFGGIGAAGFARDRYTLNRDIRRFEADLTPEEMERWQAVKQVATSGDVEGVREFVKYTMRDDSLTPQEKKDEIAYIYNVMKQSAMEGVVAEQTEEAVEAETQDILAHSDQAANTYTECNRIVVNDVGEMVEQPGHIVGYMGGQPLWIPDGAEPGTEAIPLKEGEYNPESIRSMPTQEVIDETAQAIREDAAEQAQRESTYSPDIVPPSIGTTFADGASQYQIVQQNPEGGWLATLTTVDDKGKPVQEIVPVTDQEYYDLMQAQIDAQEAGARKEQQPAAPATYSINQEKINSATVSDYKKANPRINESYYEENPENIKRDLSERARYAADYLSGRISDRDYLLSLNYVDTYLDRIGKDQIRAMADEESRNYMPYLNREEDTQQPAPANPVQSDAQIGSKTMPPSLQGANIAPVQTEQQPSSEIPTDEKGNLLYHRAPVERTVSSINSEGLEPEEVDAFIQANKDAAAKQLKSIEGKAPKMGTNIAKYKADKAAWQEKVADAQAQVDYWNQVGETISAQRTQVGDTTAEDIRAMGEPMNGHELAAMMLAMGRLPLLQSDFKRETGYKGDEARSLFGLFASEANGGMTIERAGEQLMLADLEGGTHFFDQDDPNAGRNAILDVLAEVRTRGDLTNYIRRNREAMAERERQAEYDAYADWCDEVMHMTSEEYEAYQEYIAENNPYEGVAVEELDRIFAEAEEEIQNNLINTSEYGQEGTSENGSETDSGPSERDEPAGEAGGREASVPVLPGAQPVLQGQEPGRAGGTETASRPADDGVRAAERIVAEGASGGEEGVGVQAGTAKEVRAIVPERQESESLLDYAERVAKVKEIADARKEVSANPTDAQKEAGNYKKGHITLDGYDITIETPKGSARYGVDVNGKPWAVQMENDYGYIRGTEGVDGDHIDVFLSDDPTTGKVYVIDQVKEDGSFDEHKVMYGFKSALAAKRAYLSNYSPGWQGLGTISEVSKEEFRKWVDSSHRKTKPFAEYKNVKVEGAQSESRNSKSSKNRLVTDERYAELKKRMKQKLRGQMNMGIDPEILAIGTEMSVYHIEKGARKFAEYAKAMIADLGDAIRPYLKSFYNGARDLPEVQEAGLMDDMDGYDAVSRFDVANFDKPVVNVLELAETVAKEQEVQEQAETAKNILTEERDAKVDGLRPATEEDIRKNPIVFYKGKGYGILMVVEHGEQTGPASFSKPHIKSVYLHNGQEVALEDLSVRDEQPVTEEAQEEQPEAAKDASAEKKPKERKKKAKKSVPLSLNDLFTQAEEQSNEQRSTEPDSSLGGRARQETERTEQRGTGGSLHGDNVPDADGSRGVPEPAGTSSRRQPVVRNQRNYRFGEEGIPVPQGDIAKLKANVEAIRTLKEIEASGQPATEEQKEILSRYVGWGGLADALNEDKYKIRNSYYKDANWNSKYLPYYEQLRELLTEEEFQSAIQSTNTSHYTPTSVIRALWDIVRRSGFKGGIVSEPAMGIGHIIGLMPAELSGQSRIGGYEIDSLSGRIATQLYPDADVKVQGYETNFVPQSKDLVITNVPFGRNAPYDKNLDRSLKRELGNAYNLHNYFIAKSLLELKEGGLGVFVTSSATMDGSDSRFREFVAARNIDLVGAIRLPNNAFLQNAGTSVTADILVFRKRKPGEPSNGIGFVSTTQIGEGTYEENGETRTKPILVNEYFAGHPDMMLGEMMTAFDAGSGGLYSGASQTLKPKAGADLAKDLEKAIVQLPENILSQEASPVTQIQERETTTLRNGTITTKDGKVYVAVNGELAPVEAKETFTFNGKERKVADAVDDYNALKETLKKLIAAEQSEEADPKALRKQLNEQYDAFVGKYGTLNRNKPLDDVFAEDYEHNLPLSLEEVARVPSASGKKMVWQVKKGKGILDRRVSYPVNEPTTAENLQDAVNISLSYKGTLDIPYMARLMNETEEQVTDEMLEQGVAYRDPITGTLVDRDTYLSGNVREKLEEARTVAESNPDYQKNVEDLMAVQPETIRFGDISYRLGTPWIPTEYINDFAENELGISGADVHYEPLLNEFVVSRRAHVTDFAKSGLYKTERMNTLDLFANALNQRKPKIYDERTAYGPTGKSTARVPNEAETQAASEKIMEISDKFIEYINGRNEIHRELERIYNDRYNNYRLKKYSLPSFSHKEKGKDGKEVVVTHYPGSNESISLREHQAKAVQRSLHESTLLAHQVGTGKTFTMITTAMEMRRLGLARKPMIVVQNATLEDFVKDFYRLYPSANVLAPSKDERSAENRKRLFSLIATGDFDAIVIPQSFLAFIPDDEGRKKELIQKRIDEYLEAIAKTDDYALQRRLQKEMQGLRDSLEDGGSKKSKKSNVKEKAKAADRAKSRVERVLDRKTDDVMSFEQLGIDALFIDEAHNFKKIGFATKMNNVKGVDSGASQRANSLLLKARWVQEKNGGRNVILATGTPITNTMAEVWTMMNFVSPDILDAYNIRNFDDFATTFGTVEPSLEFTATGNFKIADRFKSYVNVPELLKAFRSHADVVLTEDVKEFRQDKNIPKLADGKMENIVIDKNEDLQDVMDMLVRELEEYNKLTGQAKREKSALPLVVFTKAKQAAIDLRLLNPNYADNPNSKTNQVVRNIVKLYKESTPDKGTQLVFCDSYQSPGEQPKMDLFDYDPDVPRFNLYEDMKEKLVSVGIPANEIAIVNNYDGERRKSLFEKVRNGDVRILLGSTEKMGVGVNVQDRLFALHHVDAPLRPMDFEQRNGRILRQGNLYATWDKPVHVLTYGVQGTLDATAYDRLRVKQEFINQMMKGNTDSRVMEEQDDEDPSGMTFSQMAATLSGDKTAQLLFAAQNKLKRLRNSKRSDANSKIAMADTIESAKNRIKLLQASRAAYEKADKVVDEHFPHGVKKIKVNGQTFTEKFGTSLDPVINTYDDSYSLNRGIAPLKLSLNDGAAEVVVHYNEGRMVYELYAGKEHIVEGRQFNGGRGLMSSIDHQLDAIHKNLSDTEANIQAQEKKIEGLTQAMNTPWGREEELKEAEKEVADLQKQLEDKAKDNEKRKKDDVLYRLDDYTTNEEEANDLFRVVDDASEIERLNNEPTIKVYRAMSLVDGKLYPPMSKKIGTGNNRVSQAPSEFGQWEVSDERPELVEKNGKNKNHIYIVKDNGKGLWVAYNPYFHTSRNPLNDQFAEAYQRPNLVTVEVEVPESELTSGYQAEGAKDPVGETKWNAGPVNRQLSGDKKRKVILSRWMRPVRIVPESEVAQRIAELIEGENVAIPDNTVTPSLLEELKKLGVKIVDGINKSRKKADTVLRSGNGVLSDADLSNANDPVSKFLGKSTRTVRQRKEFSERERRNMAARVQELAGKLHLDNVEIVTDVSTLQGRRAKAKGFFNPTTGKITIVIPNHAGTFDAEQTLLHEAVAHYGLRQLFGEHFDTFLDNVFRNADVEVRRKIVALAQKNGWDTRLATEEYLASLAEGTNFDDLSAGWWRKIKELFLRMLHKIGFEGFDGVTLSDNELRYILWRSYENLREPGRYRSILGQAEDIAKQYEMKVGNYAPTASSVGQVAESAHSAKAERIRKLRESQPVDITGEEYQGKYELNRDSAQKYVLDNLRGEYTIKDTGEKVNLSKVGAKKVTSHSMGNEAHLKSIAAIPQLISNAIFIEERPPYKEGAQYDSYRYYVTGLKINGEDYTVRMTIGVKNGKYYYDHYLTNIEKGNLIEIAQGFTPTEDAPNPSYADDKGSDTNSIMQADGIEKGTLIDNLNGMAKSVAINQSSPVSGIKDTKLLSILQADSEENLLFRETPDGNTADDGTREAYNRAVSGNRFKAQEAYQDSMLALKRLQEVIEQRTGKLKSFENAYMAENQMSSKSTREAEVYGEKFFKPMLEAVGKLIEQGASYGEIIDYMVAKHGLERNEVFAERDARQEADRRYEKLYLELDRLYDLGGITEDEYEERKDGLNAAKEDYYQNRLAQHLDEDYSGLTALAEKYDALEKGFEAHAKELVRNFEVKFDTGDLWAKVNAATKETLRKSYESGMMSRDTYNKVKGQFKHYIPLRGWDEQTAEDVYEYLNSETSPVNSVLKAAKGRRSMADDPLATIGNMAESTILQGNRNLMKQAFLNMAINHPTDVLTLKEAWYVQDPSTGEWTLSFPDIQEVDDADTVSAKVEEHEQRMRELKADGLATQVKEGLNINYRIGTRQAQEHIVTVKRNGRDYLVYVNGNPRAAQAVNGLTNPTVESNKLLAGIARFNRELAANFTNRNPAFVLSNLSRDLIFSVSAVAIKENPRYAAKFAKNIPRAMRVIFRNLRGKGSETNADDRLFEEFLANGGETGYTSLHSVDEYKKLVKRSVDKYAGKRDYFAAVRSAAGFFSMMNRWAEDVSRFTTYMTSKEEGRSVTEAVNDAKEVTVNFNRRGAATKTEGVFGWTSGLFRNLYLFFNAAVQSLTNFARLAKKNRKGFLTALGGFTAAGFLVPWLNTLAISMLDGDDDDYYGNLPDWVRRNNLCLYAGNGKFITIPLPIELRAFYGLGEMAYQATVRQDYDKDQIAYQAVNQITELLPINPLGNNGDLVTTMMPDVLSPFWQIYENKDFTGKPIYRENAFNKTMPEWTKAYNSTSDWLVDLSRWTNELAGGDDYKQAGVLESLMNWNPAKVEHLFESYFGGMAKTINQAAKTLTGGVESVIDGEKSDDLQWYSTPVLNRFINDASDDRSAYSKLNQRYYKLYDLYDEVQKLNRGYANEVARGNMDYLDKLVRLQQSRDFKVYQLFRRSKRAIDRIRDIEKHLPEEGSEQRRKELQEETNRLKRQLLERVDELE